MAVYTRIAPRGPPSYPPTSPPIPRSQAITLEPPPKQDIAQLPGASIPEDIPTPTEPGKLSPTTNIESPSQSGRSISATEVQDKPNITSQISPLQEQEKTTPPPPISTMVPAPAKTVLTVAMGQAHGGQDSPVMNETLSVIDEHITDMNSPHHSVAAQDRRGTNDSGS